MEINEEYRGIKYTCTKEGNRFKGKITLDSFCQEISRDSEYELTLSLHESIDEFHKDHPNLSSQKKTNPKAFLILAFIGLTWLFWLWFYFPEHLPQETNTNTSNTSIADITWFNVFGPYFNNLGTPVIALLSYMGLLYTLFQQSKAHKLSLEELELTRQELHNSSEAQRAQATALQAQNKDIQQTAKREKFDSTFYSLLDKHNEILKSIEENALELSSSSLHKLDATYDNIHRSHNHCRYFRVLYQLLKFIAVEFSDEAKLNDKLFSSSVTQEEKSYASFVRSMLSDHTLYLLAANSYCPKGIKDPYFDYKRLITRYQFLEHLTFTNILGNNPLKYTLKNNPLKHKEHNHYPVLLEYEREAFGKNIRLIEAEDEVARFTNSIQFTTNNDGPIFETTPGFNISDIDVTKNRSIIFEQSRQQIIDQLLNAKLNFVKDQCRYINTEKNSVIKQLISILVEGDIDQVIDAQQQRRP
ncbi:TPA: hypothetical protein NJ584_003288 [Vibrio parahaemolyticus]|nr:hypothetical protein [Vibrio parahaemolyticus]